MNIPKAPTHRGTRFQKSGKQVSDRRVYVSWLDSNEAIIRWKQAVYERFLLETGGPTRTFGAPLQTGDAEAGAIKKQWLKSLTGTGPKKSRAARITDIVGVCTVTYLNANTRRLSQEVQRELEEFIAARRDLDEDDQIRVWLAPLERSRWRNYIVGDVILADPDGSHREWLFRLKDDNDRYTWPSEDGPSVSNEVLDLVETVTGNIAK
jgi:hypothetical protein